MKLFLKIKKKQKQKHADRAAMAWLLKQVNLMWLTLWFESWSQWLKKHVRHVYVHAQNPRRKRWKRIAE